MGINALSFIRNPNIIYTVMDFEEGEEIAFAYLPDNPIAIARGMSFDVAK